MKAFRIPYFVCRFTLEGLNLERFVNMLGKADIPVLSLKRTGIRTLVCECYEADMPQIETMVTEKGWKMSGPKPLHLAAFIAFLRRRWGIPLGIVLMIALTVTLYQFLWRVDIRGGGAYTGDISAFLLEEKLTPGILKTRVDAAELTRKLTYRYPKVAWFNAYVHDVTLVVDCTLGVPAPDLEYTYPEDVVATRDGVVTSVLVYAGIAAVKPGDIVREGQVLIRGTERLADEGLLPVNAQGIVTARCWMKKQVNVPLYEVQSTPTGRVAEHQQICTPWLRIPAQLETPSFLAYDTEISTTPLIGSFFPCWVQKTTFHEVAMEYTPRDVEEVKKEAAAAAMEKLTAALWGNEMIDKWVDYCMIQGELLAATATAEWIAEIGSGPAT